MGASIPQIKPAAQPLTAIVAHACLALAILLPLAALVAMFTMSVHTALSESGVRLPAHGAVSGLVVATWQFVLAGMAVMVPVGAVSYGLWRVARCLRLFARGDIFSLAAVRHLRGFAAALCVASVAGLLVPTVVGLLLTLNAPAGQKALVVTVGAQQLLTLLFAAIVWQIAHVMARAVELSDEHSLII